MAEKERSSGVPELIARLREEGVKEGKEQSDRLIEEARRRAAEILDQARQEATGLLQHAQKEADSLRTAGEDALRLARRDTVLSLKDEIAEQFANAVRRLVTHCLDDKEFVRRLILEIAGRAVPRSEDHTLELLLPERIPTVEELQRKPELIASDTLSRFVSTVARDLLREGITCGVTSGVTAGVTVRVVDEDVEIHLTDKAISDLLLQHLLPRFRAMMNHTA